MSEQKEGSPKSSLEILRDEDGAWLKVLYAETWKQYAHEDALTQSRTAIFQVIPVVLLALVGATPSAFGRIGCATAGGVPINLSLLLIGIIWMLVAILMRSLATAFESVTNSGQFYVNLRGVTLRALERLAGFNQFGPALLEHALVREFKPSVSNQEYQPFASIPELASFSDLSVRQYSQFGGFTYLRRIIRTWRFVSRAIFVLGTSVLLVGLSNPYFHLDRFIPSISCAGPG